MYNFIISFRSCNAKPQLTLLVSDCFKQELLAFLSLNDYCVYIRPLSFARIAELLGVVVGLHA